MDVPPKLITGKYHIGLKLLPFLGLLMLSSSGLALLGSQAANLTLAADERAALIQMALGGLGIFLSVLALNLLLLWSERRGIRRLFGDVWACWEQYADDKSWKRFVKEQHEKPPPGFPTLMLLVLIALLVITGVSAAGGAPLLLTLLVIGLVVALMLGFLTKYWLERRVYYGSLRHRESAPPPKVYIGKWGLYHEDEGYTALGWSGTTGRLSSVEFNPPSEKSSRWGKCRVSRALLRRGSLRTHHLRDDSCESAAG